VSSKVVSEAEAATIRRVCGQSGRGTRSGGLVGKRAAALALCTWSILSILVVSDAGAEVTVAEYRKLKDDPVVTLHVSAMIQGIDSYDAALAKTGSPRAFCAPRTAALNRDKYLKTLDAFLASPAAAAVIKSNPSIGEALMLAMTKAYPCARKE
jgi:hypothetical protein